MPIRKKGKSLKELNQRLYLIKSGTARAVLTKNLAEQARTLVMNEFRKSQDPYGNQWKPVLRGGKPLEKTGRGKASFRGEPSARGFRIVTNVFYMVVQNYGATIRAKTAKYLRFQVGGRWASKKEIRIPARQIIPEGRLGPVWTAAFVRVTNRVLKGILEGSNRGHG